MTMPVLCPKCDNHLANLEDECQGGNLYFVYHKTVDYAHNGTQITCHCGGQVNIPNPPASKTKKNRSTKEESEFIPDKSEIINLLRDMELNNPGVKIPLPPKGRLTYPKTPCVGKFVGPPPLETKIDAEYSESALNDIKEAFEAAAMKPKEVEWHTLKDTSDHSVMLPGNYCIVDRVGKVERIITFQTLQELKDYMSSVNVGSNFSGKEKSDA